MRGTSLGRSMREVESRARWVEYAKAVCAAVLVWGTLVLGADFAAQAGWISTRSGYDTARGLAVVCAVLGGGAWLAVAALKAADRRVLAEELERSEPRLMDRLHTLLYLRQNRGEPHREGFEDRIHAQTERLLMGYRARWPRLGVDFWRWFGGALLVLGLVAWMPRHFTFPESAAAGTEGTAPAQAALEERVEGASEPRESAEAKRWGEVVFTEPARDLQVTRVDVVPLQIEAATSETLQSVEWVTEVNGVSEKIHGLPPSGEPRFAIHRPTIFLEDFGLGDWDVLSYYARARTESGKVFTSQVYFIEVLPFREEMMGGGGGGKSPRFLGALNALIEDQRNLIKQTRDIAGRTPLPAEDLGKLVFAEGDLAKAMAHLFAEIAAEAGYGAASPAEKPLERAEQSAEEAAGALQKGRIHEGSELERDALQHLVLARKAYTQGLRLGQGEPSQSNEGTSESKVELPQKVAEFRDAVSAVQRALNLAVAREQLVGRDLEQLAAETPKAGGAGGGSNANPDAKREEKRQRIEKAQAEVIRQFEAIRREHLDSIPELGGLCQKAGEGLARAQAEAAKPGAGSGALAREAVARLEELRKAHAKRSQKQELQQAKALERALEKQIESLGNLEKTPQGPTRDAAQKEAKRSKELVDELKQCAGGGAGAQGTLGAKAKEALSEEKVGEIEKKLQELEQAPDGAGRAQAAGSAKEALAGVKRALEQGHPEALRRAHGKEGQARDRQASLEQGMRQLKGLMRRMESGKAMGPADQAQQAKEAAENVEFGLSSENGQSEGTMALVREVRAALETPDRVTVEMVRSLISRLENAAAEVAEFPEEQEKTRIRNMDTTTVPPAFRGRVERYFQKLSEKPEGK
ncbi:MAG: hypothetical protein RLZZ244_993 [Verrucomicrobiota bacterium]